jgi:hypothetical protein
MYSAPSVYYVLCTQWPFHTTLFFPLERALMSQLVQHFFVFWDGDYIPVLEGACCLHPIQSCVWIPFARAWSRHGNAMQTWQ